MTEQTAAAKTTAAPAASSLRDWRIDFFRGLAIIFILWNHSSPNVLSWLTTRNYGLSDSAELFVFLSGYAMATMFVAKFLVRPVPVLPYVVMRAFTLYIHHITAFIIIATIASTYRGWAGSSVMERDLFIRPFFIATETVMPKLATLAYLPPLLDILPLYILLTLMIGVLFFLFRDRWLYYVAFAIPVWAVAWFTGLNFSSYPDTRLWSLNPLSWQAVFLAGFCLCLVRDEPWLRRLVASPIAIAASVAILVIGFVAVAPWAELGLVDWRISWLPHYFDKMYASPVRLIHFLAMAHIATLLISKDNPLGETAFARSIILIGRKSLPLFVICTVFASASYAAFDYFGRSYPVQIIYEGVMTLALVALAYVAAAVGNATRGSKAAAPVAGRAAEPA
ncbi:OpgC domain-containing protein [Methylopila sp. M107]|uniref:OpgC domain-containing protein n=1 Tax=Methylopila sp. M107 TaxID=1101190 RepID=UPI00036A19C5|nr:OpgC domain-containing protein [Methylopila sp. M107]